MKNEIKRRKFPAEKRREITSIYNYIKGLSDNEDLKIDILFMESILCIIPNGRYCGKGFANMCPFFTKYKCKEHCTLCKRPLNVEEYGVVKACQIKP